jgi:hypothetical protein
VLAAPGFDVSRLRAAAGGAQVLTGAARGAAEYPELERTRTVLIPVTAAFGGLAMFIAIFRGRGTSEQRLALMSMFEVVCTDVRSSLHRTKWKVRHCRWYDLAGLKVRHAGRF